MRNLIVMFVTAVCFLFLLKLLEIKQYSNLVQKIANQRFLAFQNPIDNNYNNNDNDNDDNDDEDGADDDINNNKRNFLTGKTHQNKLNYFQRVPVKIQK